MSGERRLGVLLVLLVGLLASASGSASAAGWLPSVDVSGTVPNASQSDISLQDVAVDAQGDAVAVWMQSTGGAEIVEAATRPAGGDWSAPTKISAAGEDVLGVEVVVNPRGDAVAVWLGYRSGGVQVVRAASRPAAGEWSDPVALSDVDGQAAEADVAIDDEGTATAIWSAGEHNDYGIVEATTRPADGDWSTPAELADGRNASPRVAADQDGNVTAVWAAIAPGRVDDGVIQSKARPAEGDWDSEPVDVSAADGLASAPRIALEATGEVTAVWHRRDIPAYNGYRQFVQTARRVAGAWSAPATLSSDDEFASNPDLTVDPQGGATVIWSAWPLASSTTRFVQVRSRAADGTWGAAVNLTTKSGLLEPSESDLQVAADPHGNVTAIWTAWATSTLVVRSAYRAADGAWGTPADLSGAAAYSLWPRLAVDPQGYVTAVWSGFQGDSQAVRSRVLDPVPPELRDLTVPGHGVVGRPVTMSVEPFDLWSPVAVAWSFGDGGSASGTSVAHCYSAAGAQAVSLTGTDAAGNQASAARTIAIEPDPALPQDVDPCTGAPVPDERDPAGEPGEPDRPGSADPRPNTDPPPVTGPRHGSRSAPPLLAALRQSRRSWRASGPRSRSRQPVGTTFRFRLDRPARVRLVFQRLRPRRPPVRAVLSTSARAGVNAYRFQGRVRGRALPPGRYRLRVSARAGGRASSAASLGFTIVR